MTIIVCPTGTKQLVDKVFARTQSYTKTKTILQREYGITISLEVQKDETYNN